MDGLFFLTSIVAIGLVMWWVVQNDRVPPDRPTRGLFAMLPGIQLAKRRGWLNRITGSDTPRPADKPRF